MTIPSEPINPQRLMDARVEYYEPDGMKLENGMIVVLSGFGNLRSFDKTDPDVEAAVRRDDHWCKISHLRKGVMGSSITFVAEYADGRILQRMHSVGAGWLVKRDSAPKNEKLDLSYKRGQVIAVLVETLAAKNLTYEQDVKTAYENADKIMNIFGVEA